MKMRLLYRLLMLAMLLMPAGFDAYAQGGSGKLPPVPKTKTTPTPKPRASATPKPETNNTSANLLRDPATVPPLTFNQAASGNLDPKTAGRLTQSSYYDEYALTALGGEVLVIQLQSANTTLAVQVFDKERAGLPILKDPRTGEFRLDTPDGGLPPGDGEYRVRVQIPNVEANAAPIAYTLKLNLTGLTDDGYSARLQQISLAFNASSGKGGDVAITKLEQLARDEPRKSGAYERLGMLYLYHGRNLQQALAQMEQAIKLGGSAIFQITHDSQWRQPAGKGQALTWKDERNGWLNIRSGQIEVTNSDEASLITASGQQIKEIVRMKDAPVIEIKGIGRNPSRYFSPSTKNEAEVEAIINLIKTHVLRKG